MSNFDNLSGPDPSTLEAADHVPEGVNIGPLRVTYTSNEVTDYVDLGKSADGFTLELTDPLFGIVRKVGEVNDMKKELVEALGAIGLGEITSHFTSTVAEYVNAVLQVPVLSESIILGSAIYALGKMYEWGLLTIGYIHQASIDELPNWIDLIENARQNPDVTSSHP